MIDVGYQTMTLTTWNTQSKELVVLAGLVVLHLPLLSAFPWFTGALYLSITLYYHQHRRAHLDPAWAKRSLPWHYAHHLDGNSNANWCVTYPLFDYVMGTRVKK
jgi:sterol desaturase/sphingolipid hydroxylase (fatty acid hydroxylase superfamily)